MKSTEITEEATQKWPNIEPEEQQRILKTYAYVLKRRSTATLGRIFNLANPNITVGTREDGSLYYRIENDENAKVLRILFRQYL